MRRWSIAASILLFAGCAHPGMGGGTIALQDSQGIQVTGEGEAEARPDLVLVELDHPVDRLGGHDALLDEHRLERLDARGDLLLGAGGRAHALAPSVVTVTGSR